MKDPEVTAALDRAEDAIANGTSLAGTGFWKAVSHLRREPELAARYADRVGALDRRAFEAGVRLRVPAWAGTAALTVTSAAGVAAVAVSRSLQSPADAVVFLAAFAALDLGTHSLAHWAVGRVLGMRFTHYFLGGPPPPRPGAKLDYASYLRVPPRRRAVMHASGAVVTKLVPFAMLPFAPSRVTGLVLVAVGVVQVLTDVFVSTKTSDWKKVRRELRASRA